MTFALGPYYGINMLIIVLYVVTFLYSVPLW